MPASSATRDYLDMESNRSFPESTKRKPEKMLTRANERFLAQYDDNLQAATNVSTTNRGRHASNSKDVTVQKQSLNSGFFRQSRSLGIATARKLSNSTSWESEHAKTGTATSESSKLSPKTLPILNVCRTDGVSRTRTDSMPDNAPEKANAEPPASRKRKKVIPQPTEHTPSSGPTDAEECTDKSFLDDILQEVTEIETNGADLNMPLEVGPSFRTKRGDRLQELSNKVTNYISAQEELVACSLICLQLLAQAGPPSAPTSQSNNLFVMPAEVADSTADSALSSTNANQLNYSAISGRTHRNMHQEVHRHDPWHHRFSSIRNTISSSRHDSGYSVDVVDCLPIDMNCVNDLLKKRKSSEALRIQSSSSSGFKEKSNAASASRQVKTPPLPSVSSPPAKDKKYRSSSGAQFKIPFTPQSRSSRRQ